MILKYGKQAALFSAGGLAYMGLELLWRGWTHKAMFFAGGTCFLLLGTVRRAPLSAINRAFLGAGAITAVELVVGLLVNRDFGVWDYRGMPLNFLGQICLPYSLLWVPVSWGAMALHGLLDKKMVCR